MAQWPGLAAHSSPVRKLGVITAIGVAAIGGTGIAIGAVSHQARWHRHDLHV